MTLRELLEKKEQLTRDHRQARTEWNLAQGISEKTKWFRRALEIFEEFQALPQDEECEDFFGACK
jgi:hypothetical protein